MGDLVDKKNARRYDDCLSYTMVASKKVGKLPRESGCACQGPLLRTSLHAVGTSASCDTSRAGSVFNSEPHCASNSPGLRNAALADLGFQTRSPCTRRGPARSSRSCSALTAGCALLLAHAGPARRGP